ncbi:hypothetical protein Ga0061061_101314 [Chelatococcus sambhunathii]|uniref:Uncharacterized protein n=1 Tax=Chelatococcus sambhunathii TaxID=363953 RepID=A0ABP1ZYL4_9HYPH|nr:MULTISPECIES: hypothetical protein [Chelatococcus]CUA84250.1 hypothetical protein Ga0061061_101314 [Chelatococcus sambhunathii]
MNVNDPIRLSDIRRPRAVAASVTRVEAERQFKFSLVLLVILTLGTAVVAIGTGIGTSQTIAREPAIIVHSVS